MNLPFDVGEYCLPLNATRGALHCHYFLFVMIRVQKPHGLSPHLSQCFSSRGRCRLVHFKHLSGIGFGCAFIDCNRIFFFFVCQQIQFVGSNLYIFYIQISLLHNGYVKYSHSDHSPSKCNCFREEKMF